MIKYVDSNIEMDHGRIVCCFRQEPDTDKKYTHCLMHICEDVHKEPYTGANASIYLDPSRAKEVIKILQTFVDIMEPRKKEIDIKRKLRKRRK